MAVLRTFLTLDQMRQDQAPVVDTETTFVFCAETGNIYGWSHLSTATDDGDTVIQPINAQSSVGRYLLSIVHAPATALRTLIGGLFVKGSAQVDFGSSAASESSLAIAFPTIALADTVEAWCVPVATADHSIDEHLMLPPRIVAGNVVPGVGFTIYATANDQPGSSTYGAWSVAWRWSRG